MSKKNKTVLVQMITASADAAKYVGESGREYVFKTAASGYREAQVQTEDLDFFTARPKLFCTGAKADERFNEDVYQQPLKLIEQKLNTLIDANPSAAHAFLKGSLARGVVPDVALNIVATLCTKAGTLVAAAKHQADADKPPVKRTQKKQEAKNAADQAGTDAPDKAADADTSKDESANADTSTDGTDGTDGNDSTDTSEDSKDVGGESAAGDKPGMLNRVATAAKNAVGGGSAAKKAADAVK